MLYRPKYTSTNDNILFLSLLAEHDAEILILQ